LGFFPRQRGALNGGGFSEGWQKETQLTLDRGSLWSSSVVMSQHCVCVCVCERECVCFFSFLFFYQSDIVSHKLRGSARLSAHSFTRWAGDGGTGP